MSLFKDICFKVETFLFDSYAGLFTRQDVNFFTIKQGSAIIHIFVQDYGDTETLVKCRAYVVNGAELTHNLLKKLLLMNSEDLRFGKFGIDKNGYIVLDHVMLGSTLDKEELICSVKEIGMMADELDDMLVKQYGGKTAIETSLDRYED
ncbi:MAG: YbjN domain-containing protein [Candidatus Eremiobacterota bacterium]